MEINDGNRYINNCGNGSQQNKSQKQLERRSKMRRGAIYARVSTRRQEQEGTIESQLAKLESYAQQQGIEVPSKYQFVDQAVSGTQLARPGLDRLRDQVQVGDIEVVLCLSPDRLARHLGAQQVVVDELKRAGVEIVFSDQPDLGDDPQAKLLLDIQGAFAEYERVVISERMRRGRLYRLKQGQAVPSQAPYGYRYQAANGTPSHWEVVAAEAPIVKQVFEWYTQQAVSIGEIAHRLNQKRVPSPGGKRWYSSTIGRLLRHPAYKGTTYYNRHQTDYSGLGQARRQGQGRLRFPRYTLRPAEEWIEIKVSPLVSEERWQMAQTRLKMNAQFATRNSRRSYLLRGLLVCGICGRTLQGRTQNEIVYYACPFGGKKRSPDVPAHTCSVRGDQVEPRLWQELTALLQSPGQLEKAWQTIHLQQQAAPAQLSHWQQRQALLKKQRQRLLDAYQADALSLPELIERQNPIDLELQQLAHSLAEATPTPPRHLDLDAFTHQIQQALSSADLKFQQEVIRLLIERIVVSDDALTVEYVIPTVNNSRLYPTCRET